MALKDLAPLIAPIAPVLVTRKCCAIYYLSSHTARTASAGCAILLHKTLEKQKSRKAGLLQRNCPSIFYLFRNALSATRRFFNYVLRSASTVQPSDISFRDMSTRESRCLHVFQPQSNPKYHC